MKFNILKSTILFSILLSSGNTFAQLWTPVFSALDSTAGITKKGVLSPSSIRDFAFYDEKKGIVSYQDKYHITNNGGALWSDSGYVQYSPLGGLCYADSQTIFAYSSNRIMKSSNGGSSFSLVTTPNPSFSNSFIQVQGRLGIAVGQSCGAAYSKDGGATWTSIPNASLCGSNGPDFTEIDIIDSNIAFIGGESGQIFKTIDGGTSWTRITPPLMNQAGTDLFGLDFVDAQRGFIIQEKSNTNNIVYKTTDGGATWTTITPPLFSTNLVGTYGAIFAQDSNTIYIGAQYQGPVNSVIYKSTNGGASYSIDFSTSATFGLTYGFDKFKKAGNFLFVGTANGGNSTSANRGNPILTRIFKRNLSATTSSIQDNLSTIKYSLVPNPAHDFITITELDFNNISAISIFSMDGKLVKTINDPQYAIDINDLHKDLYFMKIETKDGQSGLSKFIKE
ncbi:MAG: T9SS type A sorting domain-containing protein [Chitinophagales bacterium]|nr:T9SS type A sorting domain-containing protein [Chitinophagales bacterium]